MTTLPTREDAKTLAKRLRRALADRGDDPGHSAALELIARTYGLPDWNTLSAQAPSAGEVRQPVTPVLRIFDWPAAQRFYLDYLGWQVDWEHRFEPDLPLYVQISGPGGAQLHLSEHHGDGTPGTAVLIDVGDVDGLHAALAAKDYHYARPGLEDEPWGRCFTVYDPFSNRITFLQPTRAA